MYWGVVAADPGCDFFKFYEPQFYKEGLGQVTGNEKL